MRNSQLKIGAAFAAMLVGLSVAAAPAQAGPKKFYPKHYGYHHHHHGYGAPLAAGIVGALALGAVAAAAASSQPSCYIEERERMDRFGNVYVRPVRVCN